MDSLVNYSLFIAAKQGMKIFLLKAIKDTWVVELKETDMLYTKVTAKAILNTYRSPTAASMHLTSWQSRTQQ